MSDEDESCQAQVSGVPKDLPTDEIKLFFGSELSCPNGGEVKSIRYLSSDVVLVTFCDSSVVDRLVGCVAMPDGTNLHVEPYKPSKSQGAVLDNSGVNTSQDNRDDKNSIQNSSPIIFNKGDEESEDNHGVMTSDRNEESENNQEVMPINRNEESEDNQKVLASGRNEEREDKQEVMTSKRNEESEDNHKVMTSGRNEESEDNQEVITSSRNEESEGKHEVMPINRNEKIEDNQEVMPIDRNEESEDNQEMMTSKRNEESEESNEVMTSKRNEESEDNQEVMPINRNEESEESNEVMPINRNEESGDGNEVVPINRNDKSEKSNEVMPINRNEKGEDSNEVMTSSRDGQMMEMDLHEVIHKPGSSWPRRSQQGLNHQDLVTKEDCDTLAERRDDSHHQEALMDCPVDTQFLSYDDVDGYPPLRDSNSADVNMKKQLSFSAEKFKLLKLVFQSKDKSNTNSCRVTFDERSHTVTIEGSADDLELMELHLYETSLQSAVDLLDIPKSSQKLLLSKRGEEWLAREFSQRLLLAVVYVSEGKAHVVAIDDAALQSASYLTSNILTSQKLQFDESAKSYLQSAAWAGKVDEAESSSLVCIDTDYSQRLILIAGNATDVSHWTAEVRKILNTKISTTRSIKHEAGVVRLLKRQSHEMIAEAKAFTGASVQLEFQPDLINVIGLLEDVEMAADFIDAKYLKVVCYDKYEVNIQGLTIEMFQNKTSLGREIIDLLELRNKCVIEVRGNSTRTSQPSKAVEGVGSKPAKAQSHRIQLQKGSIVEFKADVLVNSIANKNLQKSGIVTDCFLKAGGPGMQQELQKSVPLDFGNDVLSTSAGGKLDAKFIFHAAIRGYRDQESLNRLYKLIRKCLEMADKQHGVKSIAFPTLGCGKLRYRPSDVAECFSRAVKTTGSNLQIFIIAFEDNLLRDFKSAFSDESTASSSDNETKDDNRIVFHINAMSEDVVRDVRENLAKRINEMVTEAPIKDEAIADLSDETVSRIKALASSGVDIEIDRKKRTITVKGMKSLVDETKMKVLKLVYREGPTQSSFRYPKHWSFYTSVRQSAGKMDHKRTELTPGGKGIFEEVSQLVMRTWEPQNVGKGSDASGLTAHTIKIRKIFCIENPSQYRMYMSRRDLLCREAAKNKCRRVNGLQGESEILTHKLDMKQLDAALASEVNECYLLHGTKHDKVDSIESTGLDSRISGSRVLFGTGTYFTESSTKADQYADAKSQRSPKGQPLYMYVCRVLLGHTFICQTPKPFKRAPCMKADCYSDVCPSKHPNVGYFDSVIGTHKDPATRLLFREFITYHPDQSYPDFLVEYERQ